jgi:hypothetical protein
MEGGWVIHLVAALNSQLKWLQVRGGVQGLPWQLQISSTQPQ